MAYRQDSDLEFLGLMSSEDLQYLVDYLNHIPFRTKLFTKNLTNNPKYWKHIAERIQHLNANTYAARLNIGKGVEYKNILLDVCDKINITYDKKSTTEDIEKNFMLNIIEYALEEIELEKLREIAATIGSEDTSHITKEAIFDIFQTDFHAGGFKSYQLLKHSSILAKLLGMHINPAVVICSDPGPICWPRWLRWLTQNTTNPAYMIPVVILVSVLRQKHLYGNQANDSSIK